MVLLPLGILCFIITSQLVRFPLKQRVHLELKRSLLKKISMSNRNSNPYLLVGIPLTNNRVNPRTNNSSNNNLYTNSNLSINNNLSSNNTLNPCNMDNRWWWDNLNQWWLRVIVDILNNKWCPSKWVMVEFLKWSFNNSNQCTNLQFNNLEWLSLLLLLTNSPSIPTSIGDGLLLPPLITY